MTTTTATDSHRVPPKASTTAQPATDQTPKADPFTKEYADAVYLRRKEEAAQAYLAGH